MNSKAQIKDEHSAVLEKVEELYRELYAHDGYGTLSMEIKFLKRGQKEVVINCGKEFRFVLDYQKCEKGCCNG